MCIKDVSRLSFRHTAIRFSKYGTFRHANKEPRLYHPYNIQKKLKRRSSDIRTFTVRSLYFYLNNQLHGLFA